MEESHFGVSFILYLAGRRHTEIYRSIARDFGTLSARTSPLLGELWPGIALTVQSTQEISPAAYRAYSFMTIEAWRTITRLGPVEGRLGSTSV